MGDTEALTVLIADDNDSDRMILNAILRKQGYEVIAAADGAQAVDTFSLRRPDIVLLDVLMPNMDGMEAARQIKALAGEDLVPIIFLTSLSDAESLAECLAAGGDDFLSKPYNKVILQAKISAFQRMRLMQATVRAQRDQIRANNEHLLQEQKVAKTVFDNVAHLGCLDARNIRHLLSPLSIFNGDVLFACQKPSGGMHVMLGDFTGHGLPAAIGAMPMAEVFYGMTGKGFGISDILREINEKLKNILPVGFFCCAGMIDLDFDSREAEVWIGGIPDALLIRTSGEVELIKSNHLPLGVLSPQRFAADTYKFTLSYGDRFLIGSDGILEAANPTGEMFGDERLMQAITQVGAGVSVFDALCAAVQVFVGDAGASDDLTLAEITMMPAMEVGLPESQVDRAALSGPESWACQYELRTRALKMFNPVPLMLHIVLEVPGLRPFSGQIYTLLAELYSNALEHGILQLSSSLKSSPQGFAMYYAEREKRLANLPDGYIRFWLEHDVEGKGGVLSVRVEDSGAGFDYGEFLSREMSVKGYSGRGIPLLSQMCRRFEYQGKGNEVLVEFAWKPD